MINLYEDYYLNDIPFNIVPDNTKNIIWAGMDKIKKEFERTIQKSLINSSSKILVNYGSYGSGKTHSAEYFSSEKNLKFVKNKKVKSFLFVFPKDTKNITEYMFQSFLSIYGIDNLIYDLKDIDSNIDFDKLLKKFSNDEEIRNILLAIINIEDKNDIKRILYNQIDQSILYKYNLMKRVEGVVIIKIFAIIMKILTYKKYDLIIFWIDEFEDITTLNRQEVNKMTSFLRDLIDNIPQKMLTYLNFVPTTFTDLDSLYSYFIGSALERRITNGVEFDVLTLPEIKIYVKELFEFYRIEEFNNKNPYFPIEERVLDIIYDLIPSELTIGKLNNILQELFEDAIIDDVKIIDEAYFNQNRYELYSLK